MHQGSSSWTLRNEVVTVRVLIYWERLPIEVLEILHALHAHVYYILLSLETVGLSL